MPSPSDGSLEPTALWVSPVANLAGVARHILDVARTGLPGWRLVVALPEGPLAKGLREVGVPVRILNVDQPVPQVVRALRAIISDVEPDIVHSHLAKADFLVALAAPAGTTLISTEHHIQADQRVFHGSALKATGRIAAHRMRLARFSHLIAVSESTKRDMQRHWKPAAPITVIRNGIDRPSQPPKRYPGLRVLSLTRLSPEKNLATTVRVFAEVHRQRPEATLTIGGVGPEEASLRDLAAELGVAWSITFAGFLDATSAMASHDVLLQPSLADNLSYSLLDAVSHGMGVAASDVGGNGEILPKQCLAKPHDVSALADIAIKQGMDLAQRPTRLPTDIPTISQMCARIVGLYAYAGHSDPALSLAMKTPRAREIPSISVVTAYYRNHGTLSAQLDALVAQTGAPQFEVIVADNEDSAILNHIVAAYRDRLDIRIVPASGIAGQCHARNVGVSSARGRYIAMSDADDVVSPRWLASLHELLEADDVLATGPMRLDRINSEAVCQAKAALDGLPEVPHPYQQLPFQYLDYEEFVFGSNVGVRRDSYVELGGLNETMLGGSEDVDFTWRWLESGRKIAVAEDAVVDYRLRAEPYAVMTQAYRYQRAQLGLWRRSQAMGRPVRSMSLKWAVQQNAKLPLQLWRWVRSDETSRYVIASRVGGVFGNLVGQLSVRGPWWSEPIEGVIPESMSKAQSTWTT